MIPISSVIDIVDGILLKQSTISHFNNISSNIDDISLGNLFIILDNEDIEKAVQLGAYGVIFDKNIEVFDKDIAYIRVPNSFNALINIIRFWNKNKNIF